MNRVTSSALTRFTAIAIYILIPFSSWSGDASSYALPSTIKPTAKYLFFYHNYYVETKGPDGDCKYYDILKVFTDHGFTVISEIRPKDTSIVDYAKNAAASIQAILDAGAPPKNVTVAGHSKGAVIAMQVASILKRPNINYVILAGCGIQGLEKSYPDFSQLKGKLLSLYASSDKVAGSCSMAFSEAKQDVSLKEIVLESGAGHQLFFKPEGIWIEPMIGWLKD